MKINYKRLIISLALPQLAGMVGSLFTVSAIPTWYATLQRPNFSPPNWLFGPAWITLYILMGISAYLIWQKVEQNKTARGALWLFWVHLVFNASWSIIFFGLQNPGLAFINIIIISDLCQPPSILPISRILFCSSKYFLSSMISKSFNRQINRIIS
jgi:tryptophan-rich sensory protein